NNILLILKCLIGAPNSMNLRNIIWHGFITLTAEENKLSKYYSILIIFLMIILSNKIITSKNNSVLINRRFVDYTNYYYNNRHCHHQNNNNNNNMMNYDELYEFVMHENGKFYLIIY